MTPRLISIALCLTVLVHHGGAEAAVTPSKKTTSAPSGRASLPLRSADPYLGAMVVDAATGQSLFERGADQAGFPASVIKLMDMLVLLDRIQAGQLNLTDTVTVTADAARVGGSQVYLAERETFSVEDLLYALMIQSANDAATALALHVCGSAPGFVELMNRKAAELKMTNTRFHSVHGLPPAVGQAGDVSSARDLATLARELIQRHPEIIQYTSTHERGFRKGAFIMRNHNHLLDTYPGCDGLKTGYITAGGFSIVATAVRNGRRVIAVVLGSKDRLVRDAQVAELLSKGFAALPPLPPEPVITNLPPTNVVTTPGPAGEMDVQSERPGWLLIGGAGVLIGVILAGAVVWLMRRRSPL
jgi:D-alanyl-D-alanine carboxypeptidase (penicillin-binding protein 5/6)